MKTFLLQIFTWWNGQTLGTRFYTWRKGVRVGSDDFGNIYYRGRSGVDPMLGHERRWVIYNGLAEGSKVPPGWHGWLHHRTDCPPSEETYTAREWEAVHTMNPTGTSLARRPKGSLLGAKAPAREEYQAWKP